MSKGISIIIVNYNVYEDILKCIGSVTERLSDINYEIIVVDNCSPDRSILNLNKVFPQVKLIEADSNAGFSAANNLALKIVKFDFILLLNPDIILEKGSLEKMYEFLNNNPEAGAAGPVQYKPGEGIEYYYSFFPSLYSRLMQEFGLYMRAPLMKKRFFEFWDRNAAAGIPFKVDWVIGSCMLTRKEIFDKIGNFEEAFFLYEEETEWQFRMNKAGWNSYIIPDAKVIHNHHSSTGKFGNIFVVFHEFRSRIIFHKKHDKFPRSVVRFLIILAALTIRLCRYIQLFPFKREYASKKITLLKELYKLLFSSRSAALSNRFVFSRSIFAH